MSKLKDIWNDQSHPRNIETKPSQNCMLLEDIQNLCVEKTNLQFKLSIVRKKIGDRLEELAEYDPNWNVDLIPEEMEKRKPEINNLKEIVEIIDKTE